MDYPPASDTRVKSDPTASEDDTESSFVFVDVSNATKKVKEEMDRAAWFASNEKQDDQSSDSEDEEDASDEGDGNDEEETDMVDSEDVSEYDTDDSDKTNTNNRQTGSARPGKADTERKIRKHFHFEMSPDKIGSSSAPKAKTKHYPSNPARPTTVVQKQTSTPQTQVTSVRPASVTNEAPQKGSIQKEPVQSPPLSTQVDADYWEDRETKVQAIFKSRREGKIPSEQAAAEIQQLFATVDSLDGDQGKGKKRKNPVSAEVEESAVQQRSLPSSTSTTVLDALVVKPEVPRTKQAAAVSARAGQVPQPIVKHTPTNTSKPNDKYVASFLDNFEWFLRNVRHGKKNETCAGSVKRILPPVIKLLNGEGIKYSGWKEGTFFKRGKPFTMADDFKKLYEEATKFEEKNGKDKGHGWVMRHSIHKLEYFQEWYIKEELKKAQK